MRKIFETGGRGLSKLSQTWIVSGEVNIDKEGDLSTTNLIQLSASNMNIPTDTLIIGLRLWLRIEVPFFEKYLVLLNIDAGRRLYSKSAAAPSCLQRSTFDPLDMSHHKLARRVRGGLV